LKQSFAAGAVVVVALATCWKCLRFSLIGRRLCSLLSLSSASTFHC